MFFQSQLKDQNPKGDKMTTKETKSLIPVEDYLSAGIHIGTKFKTNDMKEFIYKINPNGLAILDVQKIDERLKKVSAFISRYDAKNILVIGRRENSWKGVKKFAETIGANYYIGRYPAGVITNPNLKDYIEPKLLIVSDPWIDKNAIRDALTNGIPIVALCDSNNVTKKIDIAIPCNNKGAKSLGLVYWILTNEYLKNKGKLTKDISLNREDFE